MPSFSLLVQFVVLLGLVLAVTSMGQLLGINPHHLIGLFGVTTGIIGTIYLVAKIKRASALKSATYRTYLPYFLLSTGCLIIGMDELVTLPWVLALIGRALLPIGFLLSTLSLRQHPGNEKP